MSFLALLMLANMSLALLGAVLLWRSSHHLDLLKSALTRTRKVASTDKLTDLPNRESLLETLSDALSSDEKDLTLMFVDLDNFKAINDTLGHLKGDELLKAVSERLVTCLDEGSRLARMGGDEFALMIEGKDAASRALLMAKSIASVMADPFQLDGDNINIQASIGIAPSDADIEDPSELLRRADVAMYVAKSEEHSGYRIYKSEMDEALKLRRTIGVELDTALATGGLQLVYQPLVCARTGSLVSAEALMRWPGKEGSAGSPGVFIPIAEETGLISKLGDWALDQALSEIKRLGNIPIAVNVSPIQFRVDGFAEAVERAIKRHNVDPKLLRIEITEGVLISHTGKAQQTMKQLRALGVQVLLDDFGTGYSSLSYLQKFEFDGLKIDRAFIQQLEDGRTGRQLLKSIIALGHSLNMKVIAEGVETEDQAAILQLLRCDQLQGYALGRPGLPDVLRVMSETPSNPAVKRAKTN
jgi:diguanylate cyclase (GGDEF)-like protein